MNANFEGNADKVIAAMREAVENALEECGLQAEKYAKKLAPVDTGRLRNSIAHKVDASVQEVHIGTNVEYGIYQELGTGRYYPGGRNTPWAYQDEKGAWHWTRGSEAVPFLKPAVQDHRETYKNIMEDSLKGK